MEASPFSWENLLFKFLLFFSISCFLFWNPYILFPSGYPGSPRNFDHTYYPNSGSYALYWEQPVTKDGHWVTKYILEEWKGNKSSWVKRHNITTLHVTIKNIESATKYRICAANEIGYKETSCSKAIQIGKSRKWIALKRCPSMTTMTFVIDVYEDVNCTITQKIIHEDYISIIISPTQITLSYRIRLLWFTI
jgi:hypothetical protein